MRTETVVDANGQIHTGFPVADAARESVKRENHIIAMTESLKEPLGPKAEVKIVGQYIGIHYELVLARMIPSEPLPLGIGLEIDTSESYYGTLKITGVKWVHESKRIIVTGESPYEIGQRLVRAATYMIEADNILTDTVPF